MAKVVNISINCGNVEIAPNGRVINVTLEDVEPGDIMEEIGHDHLCAYIDRKHNPEDIFSETQLERWAEANGYVKSTDNE